MQFYKIKTGGGITRNSTLFFPCMREWEIFWYCHEVTSNTAVVNMNKSSSGDCCFVVITWEWFRIIILFLLALI